MPIYEYVCDQCSAKQELMQKFDDAPPETCSQCGAKGSLSKAVSGSAFHLKGGGWYKDLYSSVKTADKSSPASTKPDSKPADKPKKPND